MARRSVRLLASIAAVATMVTTFAACGNKQATTDENGKPIVNILVRRNVTDHPMQDTQYTKDLEAACDCTIKWQEVSDNAWGQQKSAKMAAGEFPDIGLSLFSMVDAAKYSTYFEDLKPHLDKIRFRPLADARVWNSAVTNGIFVRFGDVELSHDEILSMAEQEH